MLPVPVLLCNKKLKTALFVTSGLCNCKDTYADLLIVQVGSDPTPVHCRTIQGTMHPQNRLSAGLWQCKDSYEGLVFMRGATDPATIHCRIAQGKTRPSLLSAALENSRLVSLRRHLFRFACHAGGQ